MLEAAKSANTNVMGGNFAGQRIDTESSRFVEASLLGMQELKDLKRSVSAQIWANSDRLGGLQGRSRQLIEREQLREKLNEATDVIKEDIKQKAQEVQAPKDAEGKPIPGASSGTGADMPKLVEPQASPPSPELQAVALELAVAAHTPINIIV